jgi:hypothetical protein
MLTCEQYDLLYARSDGDCEICGGRPDGPIVDHDPQVGQWAVRGLLCFDCNIGIGYDGGLDPDIRVRTYLANPWHLTFGVAAQEQPEPPCGASVKAFRHEWLHGVDGWHRLDRDMPERRTWVRLNRHYGPHNLVANDAAHSVRQMLSEATRLGDKPTALRLALDGLRVGIRPTEVARLSPFTDSYIRKAAREAGLPPVRAPRGITAQGQIAAVQSVEQRRRRQVFSPPPSGE